MHNQNLIGQLAKKYRASLTNAIRPNISDFLDSVSPEQRDELIRELVPIDVKFRKRNGEFPSIDEYSELGETAISIASSILGTSESRSSTSDNNHPTVTNLSPEDQPTHTSDDFYFNPATDTPPMQIGPYQLIEKIGSGGMGTVWLAKQEKPVRRRVAIKLISRGDDDANMIARFEAERQAVAMMDHQNIARIFDAGTTEEGSPFFAMELIEGIKLNKYCDLHELNIQERLRLMIPVCMAVQHAHQKGIIHRDLKHSNVLVTVYDGKPVPKIIDFGLAKALKRQQILTEKTLNSELGKIVGTIQYMSPEQASLDELDIDTRTDIYSLGAMIYKLLTGSTPIKNQSLKKSSIMKVLHEIQDREPELPSARLESANVEKLSKLRSTTPERLKQSIKGDLDWILAKALATDRDRRYETAYGLALDLERFLDNKPVKARPPSTWYNLQKFVVRNSRLVMSMAAILFLLVAGILGTSYGLRWALKERNRANIKSEESLERLKAALIAEREARESEARRQVQQQTAESRLRAIRIKSAWSDWRLGNTNFAWQMLNELSENDVGWESRFLCTEFLSAKDTLYGNASAVEAIAISPNQDYLASGTTDHRITVRDMQSKNIRFTTALEGAISSVCFSPDSTKVAFGDQSNHVTVLDVETGKIENTLGPYPTDVMSLSFLGNDRLVAGFAHRNSRLVLRVTLYDESTKPVLRIIDLRRDSAKPIELTGHVKDITSVAVSDNLENMISCSADESICVWNKTGDTYSIVKTIESAHRGGTASVKISPDGKTFASCGNDMMVRLWDLKTHIQIESFAGHQEKVFDVSFSKDGKRIASASKDRTARVWDIEGKLIRSCFGHFDAIGKVIFASDGNEIYTASDDHTIRIWDANKKPGTVSSLPHDHVIWQADLMADRKTIVSASEEGKLAFTDVESGKPAGEAIQIEDGALLCVKCSPNSELVAFGGAFNDLKIQPSRSSDILSIPAHGDYIWDIDISHDGAKLITASADNTARIWDTSTWELIAELTGHTGELGSARFSPDGRYIVTGSDDETIKLWNAKTYQLMDTFRGHTMGVWRAIFSPDGSLIASSSYDGDIMIWDIKRGKRIRQISAHTNQIAGLCFSKDGSRIVSASDDQTIKIWEVKTGIELFVLRDQNDVPIVHVSISKDGRRMISGNSDGRLTIRTASDLNLERRPKLPQDALEFSIETTELVLDPENTSSDFEKILRETNEWNRYFPGYELLTISGIAQYELGEYELAYQSLVEAKRLEKILYGESDLRPSIEGYLALTCHHLNKPDMAERYLKEFTEKASVHRWFEDEAVARLIVKINSTMPNASRFSRSNASGAQSE